MLILEEIGKNVCKSIDSNAVPLDPLIFLSKQNTCLLDRLVYKMQNRHRMVEKHPCDSGVKSVLFNLCLFWKRFWLRLLNLLDPPAPRL